MSARTARTGGRFTSNISVSFVPEDHDAITRLARERQCSFAAVVRQLVRVGLQAPETKKADQ